MTKRPVRIVLIALIVVEAAVLILIVWSAYYSDAWAFHDSLWDEMRFEQLKTLHAALADYKGRTGAWPADLEAVRERYLDLLYAGRPWEKDQSPEGVPEERRPFVGFPPLTGPHRVEYFNPPLGGTVVLRSYGHLESQAGWDLRRDPVTMDCDVRGEVTFPPVGRKDDGATPGPRP